MPRVACRLFPARGRCSFHLPYEVACAPSNDAEVPTPSTSGCDPDLETGSLQMIKSGQGHKGGPCSHMMCLHEGDIQTQRHTWEGRAQGADSSSPPTEETSPEDTLTLDLSRPTQVGCFSHPACCFVTATLANQRPNRGSWSQQSAVATRTSRAACHQTFSEHAAAPGLRSGGGGEPNRGRGLSEKDLEMRGEWGQGRPTSPGASAQPGKQLFKNASSAGSYRGPRMVGRELL